MSEFYIDTDVLYIQLVSPRRTLLHSRINGFYPLFCQRDGDRFIQSNAYDMIIMEERNKSNVDANG